MYYELQHQAIGVQDLLIHGASTIARECERVLLAPVLFCIICRVVVVRSKVAVADPILAHGTAGRDGVLLLGFQWLLCLLQTQGSVEIAEMHRHVPLRPH